MSLFAITYELTRADGSLDRSAIRAKARKITGQPEYRAIQSDGNFSLHELVYPTRAESLATALRLAISERERNSCRAALNDQYAQREALLNEEAERIAKDHGYSLDTLSHAIARRSSATYFTARHELSLYKRARDIAGRRAS